jgi:hypothetical protein
LPQDRPFKLLFFAPPAFFAGPFVVALAREVRFAGTLDMLLGAEPHNAAFFTGALAAFFTGALAAFFTGALAAFFTGTLAGLLAPAPVLDGLATTADSAMNR